MTTRQEKISSLIKELAAEFLQRESSGASMITVTTADISKDLKNSNVYLSVLPEEKENEALNFAKRQRAGFRDYFKERVSLKNVPLFDFKIDEREKHRQRIDKISNSIK